MDRTDRIGASEIAAIFGLHPYMSGYELSLSKLGLLDPWKGNAATHVGTRLEPSLLDEAESVYGRLSRNVVKWAPDGCPVASTCDAIIDANGEPVDAKVSDILMGYSSGNWGPTETDQVPDYIYLQMQTQCWCAGSDRAHVIALLPRVGFGHYHIEADPQVIGKIRQMSLDWWDKYIIQRQKHPIDSPCPMDVESRRLRQRKSVELPDSLIYVVDRYLSAASALDEAKLEEQKWKAVVCAAMGDADSGILPDGRLVSYRADSRGARRFRIKNPKKGI